MDNTTENNKRIAKNTLMLYFRMLFLMAVSLYTSRVVLNVLGVEDFGIYNVVGGVVAMFSMLSGSLSTAITRFITYELGTGNKKNLKKIFSIAITIQIILAVLIILIAEIVGVWFINTKMIIDGTRINAANWVFQFSLISFAINLISIPYNATIIAHEKMSAFAYISILETVGKLVIAYLITISPIDKLIFYAILMFIVAFIIRITYGMYCKREFEECNYQFILDRNLLKQMFGFAGWNFIGVTSTVLRDQGGNIIINLFCGPSINAARGIATQVNNAINGFVTNFMTALNPQIIKNYAIKNHSYLVELIFQGARFSFYMLLLLSLPVLINTHYILKIWLNNIIPDHTVTFVQLILIFAMSESMSYPLITAQQATGKIRNYQILVGGLQMMNLPISYILLHMGSCPEMIFIVAIIISQLCLIVRLILLKRMIMLPIKEYLKKVYFNVYLVSISSLIIPFFFFKMQDDSFTGFITSTLISILNVALSIYFIGCNKNERQFIQKKILKK